MVFVILLLVGLSYDSFLRILFLILLFSAIEIILIISATFKYMKKSCRIQPNCKEDINKYVQVDLTLDQVHRVEIDSNESVVFLNIVTELYSKVAPSDDSTGTLLVCNSVVEPVKYKDKEFDLVIENEKVNDLPSINKYFKSYHKIIVNGGILILSYKNSYQPVFEKRLQSKIGKLFHNVIAYVYGSVISKVNSLLSRPQKRILSKTEVWGRLAYYGFDVLHEIEHDGFSTLIASKVQSISDNPNPSSAHLIKLNRVGYAGKIIKIYKIRTMYPYSEFLQEKVFKMNQLTSTGKINEDFRITKPGKIYRKYWVDELPQLLDWMRGEIKLVGIRAMSQHFFSLYPEEYKALFVQVKPGIISPIFDDENDDFGNIVKIEQDYLEQYLRNPLRTDIKYMFLTLKHIVSGVRSN
jgi:lipopolysaccharide/colanic/teichoic acid biosynthesis glycosyltransferase